MCMGLEWRVINYQNFPFWNSNRHIFIKYLGAKKHKSNVILRLNYDLYSLCSQ